MESVGILTIAFKRNPSGRIRIYEYLPPPAQLSRLVTALFSTVYGVRNILVIFEWGSKLFPYICEGC
jgi:hypothetical protein